MHFIHKLGPEVVKLVEGCRKREWHLEAMVEATQVLEMLLDATPVENSKEMCVMVGWVVGGSRGDGVVMVEGRGEWWWRG